MDVRDLLTEVADAPAPPPRIDVDLARRRGRLRRWLRRSFGPAAVALAAVAALTVPHSFSFTERAVEPSQRPASPAVTPQFGPFKPYATFGWLPPGFTTSGTGTSDAKGVSDWAKWSATGRTINLVVNARGACTWSGPAMTCADDGFESLGPAPDVDGHRAVWTVDGIAWQYVSGGWASVHAGVLGDQVPGLGWAVTSSGVTSKDLQAARAEIQAGKLIPQSAKTRASLMKVADDVRYGASRPVVFPFRLERPLPAGWSVTRTSFTYVGGRLAGGGLSAGPASDPAALGLSADLSAGPVACDYVAGESAYLKLRGARWLNRVSPEPGAKGVETLCSSTVVDGLGVEISLDMSAPGSAGLGGAEKVLLALRLLGPDTTAWTTTPAG